MNQGLPKVAGAPISWGVSELVGWGFRMPPDRVLSEMRDIGLDATELGPPGYLPEDATERRRLLDGHELRLVAGFLAAVLHLPRSSPSAEIERQAHALAASGAEVLVLAAALPGDSYDRGEHLSGSQWRALAGALAAAQEVASEHGLKLAFHPHAGTAVTTKEDVERLLESTEVEICVDTGHLVLGGADPAQVVRDAGARVRHVHLKDVDSALAGRVRSGELTYAAAVRVGLYRPLGRGDVDLEAFLGRLEEAGYQGWYVLEQDTALTAEPAPDQGPIKAARESLEYFRLLASAKQRITASKED